MYTDPWSYLGVSKDADKKTIRKAYAASLKHVNPEDHPTEFQALRDAYETVLKHLQRRPPTVHLEPQASDENLETDSVSPNFSQISSNLEPHSGQTSRETEILKEILEKSASEIYEAYLDQSEAGDGDLALEVLDIWMSLANTQQRREFDELLFEDVLSGRMKRYHLLPLIWKFYRRDQQFLLYFQPPHDKLSHFQRIFVQTIEEDLMEIRWGFAKMVADDKVPEGLANLDFLLSTKAFDNFERRHLLRITLLRFASRNPYLSAAALEVLEDMFQFSSFLSRYSSEDYAACVHLLNRIHAGDELD